MKSIYFFSSIQISIHAPARGASIRKGRKMWPVLFQFTPLREGLQSNANKISSGIHFNSRPCERGFPSCSGILPGKNISIHAPARGASKKPLWTSSACQISIHAPARGASLPACRQLNEEFQFQFTPLREGLRYLMSQSCIIQISIHAPARGASDTGVDYTPYCVFQFTPLREGLPR